MLCLLDKEPGSFVFRMLRQLRQTVRPPLPPIDLSIGAPDGMPPQEVIEKLRQEVLRHNVHSYASGKGEVALRDAVAEWYLKRFGVSLNPETEILPLLGAKRAIVDLVFALAGPQKGVLVPEIGYPTYRIAARLAGVPIFFYPLLPAENYAPCLEELQLTQLKSSKLVFLNYPHNPTGGVIDLSIFEHIVNFAHRYNLILCHDNPYSEITFDGFVAPSILQCFEAKKVAVEIISFSKTFNMAGWRIACLVGNPCIISAVRELREDLDSGLFIPIQLAAAEALKVYFESDIRKQQSLKYENRRNAVIRALMQLEWQFFKPLGAMYIWAKPPIDDALAFTKRLYELTGVLVVPGDAYGPAGKGWVRISLVHDVPVLEEAFSRIAASNFLGKGSACKGGGDGKS